MININKVKRLPALEDQSFRITMLYQVEIAGIIIVPIMAIKDKSSPKLKVFAQKEKCFVLASEAWSEIRKLILARIDDDIRATKEDI